jgi:hypothetical protein
MGAIYLVFGNYLLTIRNTNSVATAGYSPDEVVNRVKALGWACLLHTSHNHKPGDIRFRIVLPLSEEIAHELPPPEVAAGALWVADGCCSLRPPNRASNPHFGPKLWVSAFRPLVRRAVTDVAPQQLSPRPRA